MIGLLLEEGVQIEVCACYRILGRICHSRGESAKAINHFEAALGIATSFNWHDHLFWINYSLEDFFFDEDRFGEAHVHIERAESHATNNPYRLGRAVELRATFWYEQHMLQEAKSEALRATGIYEKLGAANGVECCRGLLRNIEEAAQASHAS